MNWVNKRSYWGKQHVHNTICNFGIRFKLFYTLKFFPRNSMRLSDDLQKHKISIVYSYLQYLFIPKFFLPQAPKSNFLADSSETIIFLIKI